MRGGIQKEGNDHYALGYDGANSAIVTPLTGRHASLANLFRTRPTSAERVARRRASARPTNA